MARRRRSEREEMATETDTDTDTETEAEAEAEAKREESAMPRAPQVKRKDQKKEQRRKEEDEGASNRTKGLEKEKAKALTNQNQSPPEAAGAESEDTKSIDSDSTLDNDNFVRSQQQRPERMTARQRAMVGSGVGVEFEGGLDRRQKKEPKELTEEDVIRKAEQNEARRKRAAKKRREALLAVERSIREGKGARQKREDKLQEQKAVRMAKRKLGGELDPGMVRISLKKHHTQVIWHKDLDLPSGLRQDQRQRQRQRQGAPLVSSSLSPADGNLIIRLETIRAMNDIDKARKVMSSLKCGGPVEVRVSSSSDGDGVGGGGGGDHQGMKHEVFAILPPGKISSSRSEKKKEGKGSLSERQFHFLGLVPKQFYDKVLDRTTKEQATTSAPIAESTATATAGGYIKSLNRSKCMIDICM